MFRQSSETQVHSEVKEESSHCRAETCGTCRECYLGVRTLLLKRATERRTEKEVAECSVKLPLSHVALCALEALTASWCTAFKQYSARQYSHTEC